MDRYSARVNLHGNTHRERLVERLKADIINNAKDNPSYKKVALNGVETSMVINSGTQPFYKTYTSLPNEKILLGDYVDFAGQTWLVYSADCDDEIYVDGDLRQCNHTMYWQLDDGRIVSRKVWSQNASAYNNGREGNKVLELLSNQFMIYMPYDEDTLTLGHKVGHRFNMTKDPSVCVPYELTRFDDLTYAYGEKGMLNLILTQHQFNKNVDVEVELPDGTKAWICGYAPSETQEPDTSDESKILFGFISGGANLRNGYKRSWSASFTDKDGVDVDNVNFSWNVVSDFEIEQVVADNKIQLFIDNEDCIGSSFLLEVIDNDTNTVIAKNEITVIEGY